MGRFATTAALYEALRPPYPPAFFRSVAGKLALSRQSRLIDLGTGPGVLALGFAPYVGSIIGVDPEPEMIAAARRAAASAGHDLVLIEGTTETLADDIGAFDIVTIGRALHWMDREPTLARLARLVEPSGVIAICASFSIADIRNPWLDGYNELRRKWSPEGLWRESGTGTRTHHDLPAFFAGSAFRVAETIRVETDHAISVHDLARRVLTFSSSSPEALGGNVDAMLRDVEAYLTPFGRDNVITEAIVSVAQIVRR